MNVAKGLKLGLGVSISVLFIWLILRVVDVGAIWEALKRADPFWIAVGVGLFGLGYACRIQRWRLMLSSNGTENTWGRVAVPFLMSIAANNVLPFRAGDVLRTFAFSRWLQSSTAHVLATMIVERLLDLLVLLCALTAVLIFVGPAISDTMQSALGVGAMGIAALAFAVAFLLLTPALFQRIFLALMGWLPASRAALRSKLEDATQRFFLALTQQAQKARMAALMGWSLLAWAFEAAVFYATARAIPDLTEPLAGLIAMPVATLSTLLPSTPGYAGTFHYFALKAVELAGNPAVASAAFAVLVHLVLWLTATLAGGLCALIWSMTQSGAEETPLRPHADGKASS